MEEDKEPGEKEISKNSWTEGEEDRGRQRDKGDLSPLFFSFVSSCHPQSYGAAFPPVWISAH